MNETIAAFLDEMDPFWHFLVPVIVSAFVGCLLGVTFSCLFCRSKTSAAPSPSDSDALSALRRELEAAKAAQTRAEAELATLRQTAPVSSQTISPVLAAARPPGGSSSQEVRNGLAHQGNLGLLYLTKPSSADDLTLISGITPAIAVRLRDLGIYCFDQISQWTEPAAISLMESTPAAHRLVEDKWIAQAKRLATLKAEGKPLVALAAEELARL